MWVCVVCGVLLVGLAVMLVFTRQYEKDFAEQLDQKEHPLRVLYPMVLYILLETPVGRLMQNREQERELLEQLYHYQDKDLVQILYWCKKFSTVLAAGGACLFLAMVLSLQPVGAQILQGKYAVDRQATGEGSKQVSLEVQGEGRKKQEISIEIPERSYTKEETEKKIQEAKAYVEQVYLGENADKEHVRSSLQLVRSVPDSSISVCWSSEQKEWITEEGVVNNVNLKKPVSCRLTATFSYESYQEETTYEITVLPALEISDVQWKEALTQKLEQAGEENKTSPKMELPRKLFGETVTYSEKIKNNGPVFLILALLLPALLWFSFGTDLKKKQKEHDQQMLLDYPELVNKFTLLLGAGMTVFGAWEKIALEYEGKKEQQEKPCRFAYEEWCITYYEMSNGVTEMQALERFGQRTKLMPYLKFSTLLGQNLRKGSKGLLELLEHEAVEAFEDRIQHTKNLAEEAGTKLLAPMMIMLALVMVLLMIPAFASL